MTLGLIGIVVSLILLITLAYRGVSIVIAAPVAALVAMVFSGAPLLASYTEIFMPGLAGFIMNFFPIFLTGAIFGQLMSVTGYAEDLANVLTRSLGAKRAMLATVLTAALLTYGGISVFVAVFVMFPITRELFRAADIPRRLIPASIALGILTFTMTALPGTPQVQNIIPGQAFGTGTYSAPGLGIIGGIAMFVLGMLWLEYRKRRLIAKGERFADATAMELAEKKTASSGGGESRETQGEDSTVEADIEGEQEEQQPTQATLTPPNHFFPFIPILLVIIVNFGLSVFIFPTMNWDYLESEVFGGITLSDRSAIWAVLCALLSAILSILLLNVKHIRWIAGALTQGAKNALLPIFNTASEVGYGAVVASLAAFTIIRDGIFGISENALVASAVSTSVISGITGSASGGMSIALNAFGEDLQSLADVQGISHEVMHRITAMASGGLDSMPHNGAVITLLLVCGMTHREAYKDVGMITLVIPVLVTAALIPVGLTFGAF